MSTRNIWDRDPAENDRQFAAFALFRDLGPDRRMVDVERETGYGVQRLYKIADKYDWRRRVQAYDSYLDGQRQIVTAREVRTMAQRQAKLGQDLQDVASKRVQEFIEKPELLATVTVSDVVRLAAEGVKIERLAEGETTGDEGQPIIFNITGMTNLPHWARHTIEDKSGNPVQEGTDRTTVEGDSTKSA